MRDLRALDGQLRCSRCRTYRPISDFAFSDMQGQKRQYYCRSCQSAYRREHYLANKADYVRRAVAQINGRRVMNRIEILRYLSAHPCVDCGEADLVVLEFDHLDPKDKIKPVGRLAMTKRWATVRREIDKCEVRCVNCHRRRTAVQFGWRRGQTLKSAPTRE